MKPIILHTGRSYTNEEKKRRAEAENVYKVGRLKLVPPDELSERAKLKFEQIAAEAFWLDELSADLLAAYCNAWDRWLDVVAAMKDMGEVIIDKKAGAKQNPYRYALRTYVSIMQELSAKLGLGNIDRLRLVTPAQEAAKKEENPFEAFMAEVE